MMENVEVYMPSVRSSQLWKDHPNLGKCLPNREATMLPQHTSTIRSEFLVANQVCVDDTETKEAQEEPLKGQKQHLNPKTFEFTLTKANIANSKG